MFASLRSRLLLSYAFLIGVTLCVIGAALFLLLVQRTTPTRQIYQDLNRIALNQRDQFLALRADQVEEFDLHLQRLAEGANVRVLRLTEDGEVLFDSSDKLTTGTVLDVSLQRQPLPGGNTQSIYGIFQEEALTRRWAYMAIPPPPNARNIGYVVLARQLPAGQTIALLRDLYPLFIQAGLIGLLIAGLLAAWITRSVARPLGDAAKSAGAIAEGDYSQRAPVSGPTEVRTLITAFNDMADKVQRARETQGDFLANVSHDLRTPLTSVQGFAQAILDGAVQEPAQAARVIYDEAGRMRRMVDDLLELAKLESDMALVVRERVSLGDLLSGIAERLSLRAEAGGVVLINEAGGLPEVSGDGDRLAQVFTNLVDNALKHTPAGGSVRIGGILRDGGVKVAVIDSGEGIPEADLPRVFERFYQVDKSRARDGNAGTGLGLTITREIVEAHGGQISVQSAREGGTIFTVWLPLPGHADQTLARGAGRVRN
jgi:signal transduction histidine kinase